MSPRVSAGGAAGGGRKVSAEAMDDGAASNSSRNSNSSSKFGNMDVANSVVHAEEGPEKEEGEHVKEFQTHAALLLGGGGGGSGGSCGQWMEQEEATAPGAGTGHPQHHAQGNREGEGAEGTVRGKEEEQEEEDEEEDNAKRAAGGIGDESSASDGGRWGATAFDDESEDEDGDGQGLGEEEGGGGEGESPAERRRRRGGDEFVGISAPPSPLLDDLLYVEDLVGLGEEGEDDGSEASEGGD